jgi:prevent-host-death family protein
MATVGVRELKNRLTHYLARTRRGEEILVTDRGVPVALLGPIDRTAGREPSTIEARLATLAARGLVILPVRRPSRRLRPVKASGEPLSRMILEDRR